MPGYILDTWTSGTPPLRNAYMRYLLQLELVDRMIARLQQRMRDSGLWRDAMVVVSADHGVSFREDGRRRRADAENLADIAGIPLFVKAPGQTTAKVDDGRARTVDIVPTLADALETRLPWRADGVSLLEGPRPGPVQVEVKGGSTVRAPFEAYRDALPGAAARLRRLLAGGSRTVYAAGPDGALVGRAVSDVRQGPPLDSGFELDTSIGRVYPSGPVGRP